VKVNIFSLLFGGHFSNELYNELWEYNIDNNMWFNINYTEDNVVPAGTAYGTLLLFSAVTPILLLGHNLLRRHKLEIH
jgi:hypothetical protein